MQKILPEARAGLRAIWPIWAPRLEGPGTQVANGAPAAATLLCSQCSNNASMLKCCKETTVSRARLLDGLPSHPPSGLIGLKLPVLEAVCRLVWQNPEEQLWIVSRHSWISWNISCDIETQLLFKLWGGRWNIRRAELLTFLLKNWCWEEALGSAEGRQMLTFRVLPPKLFWLLVPLIY